jgi:hypothetical protein
VPSIARWRGTVSAGSVSRAMTSSMDFFATALDLAHVQLPSDRTIDAISYVGLLKAQNCGADGQDYGNRSTFYYWGKNPSPSVGLHAVRHSARGFGNWKLHWVTEGSHCNDDYPDKECPASRGLRVLAPQDLLLYNLDVSPGETRNLSVAGLPEVVAKLTQLKRAHEAEPDIFGRSEVHRGNNQSYQPCAARAVAAGCTPATRSHSRHPVPHWPAVENYSMSYHALASQPPYRTHQCRVDNSTEAALTCERQAAQLCVGDSRCAGFALCDWNAQCGQESARGVAQLFTAAQVANATSDKPFWTLWLKGPSRPVPPSPALPALAGQWPLCCQQQWEH